MISKRSALVVISLALLFCVVLIAISQAPPTNPRDPTGWLGILWNELRNLFSREETLADKIERAGIDVESANAQEQAARNQRNMAYEAWQNAVGAVSTLTSELKAIEDRMASLEATRDEKAEELKNAISPSTLWRLEAEIASLNSQIQAEILRAINKRWEIAQKKIEMGTAQNHYILDIITI